MARKKLDFQAVRDEFTRHISLWLKESQKSANKYNSSCDSDYRKTMYREDSNSYRSMAHAEYILGKELGVVTVKDFPQFAQDEKGANP